MTGGSRQRQLARLLTRLALAAAASDGPGFPDGFVVVELAPLANPIMVPLVLASYWY